MGSKGATRIGAIWIERKKGPQEQDWKRVDSAIEER